MSFSSSSPVVEIYMHRWVLKMILLNYRLDTIYAVKLPSTSKIPILIRENFNAEGGKGGSKKINKVTENDLRCMTS